MMNAVWPRRRVLALGATVFLVTLFVSLPATALVYRLAADGPLADRADLIVEGRIVDRAVVDRDGRIVTLYVVAPVDVIKGIVVGSTFGVEVLGGELPDGRFLSVPGLPRFDLDQDVLLFLRSRDNGRHRILHMMQGVFYAAASDEGRAWYRPIDGGSEHAAPTKGGDVATTPTGAPTVRDGVRFAAWLRDRAAGIERAPDYHVEATEEIVSKFNVAEFPDGTIGRWFAFDRGERVQWFRDARGQPGSADGGTAAFAQARQAWNRDPETPVRYRNGGTTTSRTGFGPLDGQSTILFRDYNDVIDTDYDCLTGGIIAVGGARALVAAPQQTWKGQLYREAIEAEIVINDGVACEASDNDFLAELYTHELGHTLGLGHSCGDEASGDCAGNPRLAAAIMNARLQRPPQGAILRSDDVAGLRFLYSPATDGCSLPPGDGRFCSDPACGPCTEGNGDCDSDAECAAGLVCGDNNGADFGFAPGIDVCVSGGGCSETLGSGRYCSTPGCGPCEFGEGDCDNDAECAGSLVCGNDNGVAFGFAPNIDVCVGTPGPGDTCSLLVGSGRFCSDPACGPCDFGEGDCDNDAECAGTLTCGDNNGADFGFAPGVDVCIGESACSETLGTGRYCSTPGCGPCTLGEGDCDSDAECATGLVCEPNVGADFGFAPGVDVCLAPSAP